jgi:hypothetical protein
MSVATYPAAYPAAIATYPPGVLTGRQMEMFEVTPTCDLYAVPEQWAVGNKDTEILQELCDALVGTHEDLYYRGAAQMDGLVEQLDSVFASERLISHLDWTDIDQLERFAAPASWRPYFDQLMEVDAALNPGKEITDALDQFEEDSDYEEFLRMNNIEEVDMEMEEALDAIDQERQEEMDWIQNQLSRLERYQDQTAYYVHPMVHRNGGVLALIDLTTSFGIEEALRQFEEDFHYEESLVQEQLKNTEVNFHRLLATPPSYRPGWCGTSGYNPGSRGCFELLNKERYRFNATVIHEFPSDRKGYALAETVYGKIYIPEKFRGYIPPVGSTIDVTVALQDVASKKDGKTNSFRFTAIYTH